MSYKIIALDLDGTLLTSNNKINYETLHALKSCLEKDIKIILTSGREYKSMEKYVEMLNLKDYQITMNGSIIFDPVNKCSVVKYTMDRYVYLRALSKIKTLPYPYLVFDDEDIYVDTNSLNMNFVLDIANKTGKKLPHIVNDYSIIKSPVKITIFLNKENEGEFVKVLFLNTDVKVMRTSEKMIEITSKGVSKGQALKYLCDKYSIDHKDIIAFGDSDNDIEMIEFAGKGIAMGNAFEYVKEKSDYVTKTNDEDGIVYAINKFVL